MRDVIWTLIGIWLIYKVIDLFKGLNTKKSTVENQNNQQRRSDTSTTKKDLHSALKKHMNKEGEYVDFEEIK